MNVKTTTAMPAESETRLMGGDQFKKKTMSHRNQTHDNFLVRQLQDDSPEQKKDPPLEFATLSYILHHLRGPNWQKMINWKRLLHSEQNHKVSTIDFWLSKSIISIKNA